MWPRFIAASLGNGVLLILISVACATAPLGPNEATVSAVIDGDTIKIDVAGSIERVRLIGIDTPEVFGQEECFGWAASYYTKSLVPLGTRVSLEGDVSERDRYGRLLRYVYLPDGKMLNETLVAEGYARVDTFPPDVRYVDTFVKAQGEAQEQEKGLWSACSGSSATPTATTGCDPSYPTVCIPPPPQI